MECTNHADDILVIARSLPAPEVLWAEEVERDLQVLGVSRWREMVTDRTKWRGNCSTGQSPQRAAAPTEEEESSMHIKHVLYCM
jgi:hypothetical protein